MKFNNEKNEVAYFMRRLYIQKLTTCSGGNISLKIDNNNILVTPSQIDKGRLSANDIGIVTIDGKNKTPELKLSMETGMHLAIYKNRPDVKAIIHAHPPVATSFTVSKKKINCNLIGESRAIVGTPVLAPYALMGSEKLAEIVSEYTLKANAVLMENHGVLTVGESLLQAFDRIEVLEIAGRITLITEFLGDKKELSSNDLQEIDDLFS
ncbi:MAG: class II aldolase/adducin family protein [Bacteroidales bacterium]|nr:class II aldolase/adducin family protein [Bacteroidales bacterium]